MRYHNSRQRRADREHVAISRVSGILRSNNVVIPHKKRAKLPVCHMCGAASRPGWPCPTCIKKLES